MDSSPQEVDKKCNPKAALKVGSVNGVEVDKVRPVCSPSRSQRRKYNHRDRWVAVEVKRMVRDALHTVRSIVRVEYM
jgi:hypothetical protein